MGMTYATRIAGHTVKYRIRHPMAKLLFGRWLEPAEDKGTVLEVSPAMIEQGKKLFPEDASPGNVEFKALISLTSKELLKYGACIFHAVAVKAGGKTWLITAPSGGGKTTQLRNWMKIDPTVEVISGDMPVLEKRWDGTVFVHPSPWNGKERIGGAAGAPLGGIVYLEKGEENTIYVMTLQERIRKCLPQFMCLPDTEEQIRSLAGLAGTTLGGHPAWLLRNRGDEESTALMVETIRKGGLL